MPDENIEKIELRCPNCKVKIRAPVSLIGKKAKCPRCQNVFDVLEQDVPLAPIELEEPKEEQPPPLLPPPRPATAVNKPVTGANRPAIQRPPLRPTTGGMQKPLAGRPLGAKPPLWAAPGAKKFGPPTKAPMGRKFGKPAEVNPEEEGLEEGIVEPPKKSKKWLIIIIVAALLVIGGVVLFLLKKKPETSTEAPKEQKSAEGTPTSTQEPPSGTQK